MNELYVTRLSTFRKAHKLTQQSFSEKISISSEHFSKIESMCKNPSLSLHIEICKQLNVPSDCFFSERHPVGFCGKSAQEAKSKGYEENLCCFA